ncbi:protein YIPF2 isoform X2 [Vidua chalybeata]|uniref:protein YIPF2 isoform X2 n=1 Tax=Vidua chalybeata TaxID=81927 RepID=UPI0023A81735|nr:protein YIPF2 isoform X2 [Vidua chalybeata]
MPTRPSSWRGSGSRGASGPSSTTRRSSTWTRGRCWSASRPRWCRYRARTSCATGCATTPTCPFWICATLALALAIAGDLSQLGSARGGPERRYRPRFHLVPAALALVFSYAALVPLGLWGCLRRARGGSGGSFSLLETLCAHGYSLSALVPAAALWALPLAWLRWAVLAALAVPGAALAATFWPPLRAGGRGPALAGGAALLALHTLLALGCQLYFFEPLSTPGSGGAPAGIPPSNASHPAP